MNKLFFGENLVVLREMDSEIVDLVYLDPPFNSKRDYNIIFYSPKGEDSNAQITAFEDTWHWGEQAEREYQEILRSGKTNLAELISSIRNFLGQNDMMAYLIMMANRLIELHRVLKPTGSLYLHCDPTASHYLKIILDAIFGAANFRNEIIWVRSTNPKGSQYKNLRYSPFTDTILYFVKTKLTELHLDEIFIPLTAEELELKYDRKDEHGKFTDGPIIRMASMGERPNLVYEYKGYTPDVWGWRVNKQKLIEIDEQGNLGWSSNGKPYRKLRPDQDKGKPVGNFWNDISLLNPQSHERLGYPTQKPLALLERIIIASSNEGDVILDPFCGCGTAVHAAHKLNRQWIGIDITHLAISLIEKRLNETFPGIKYEVVGTPKDLDGARDLATRDKYQFQWWVCSLVGAQPYQEKKKGADGGIDGLIFFNDVQNNKQKTGKIIVSVKGGENVTLTMLKDLIATVQGNKAEMGIFVTLKEPTRPMVLEALNSGYYQAGNGQEYPKIQILTIEDILSCKKRPQYYDMSMGQMTFKKSKRDKGNTTEKQTKLNFETDALESIFAEDMIQQEDKKSVKSRYIAATKADGPRYTKDKSSKKKKK